MAEHPGVAMGRGADIAKATAGVVLQDDRFETIAAAVEEGRVIFDNLRKFIFYLFSCDLGEIFVFLGAGLAGWPAPLVPLQISGSTSSPIRFRRSRWRSSA